MRVRVVVHGRVQGVGFRYGVASRARSLGIAGSVRNCGNGTVEAFFEGPRERVESLVAWCRRGPSGARVDSVDVAAEPPTGEEGFA